MLKEIINKIFKKLPWFFFLWTHFLFMGKAMKNRKGLKLVTNLPSGCKTHLERSFFSYLSPRQFSWFNTNWFLSYSKNYICYFMQANSQRHNYSSFIWNFEFENYGKGEKKIQKLKNLGKEKSYLDEIKRIFHNFWNAFFW